MFATIVNGLCTLTNFAFAGYDTYKTCQRIKEKSERNEPILLRDKIEVVAKTTSVAMSVFSMGATHFNSTTESSILSRTSEISGVQEKLSQATKVGGSLCDQAGHVILGSRSIPRLQSEIETLRQGYETVNQVYVASNVAGMSTDVASFVVNPDKDLRKFGRTVVSLSTRSLGIGEGKANLSRGADFQRAARAQSDLESLSTIHVVTQSVTGTVLSAYEIYKRHRRRPEIARQIAIIHYPSHQRNLPLEIPIQFHEDEFFAAHICPITANPIRFPAFLEENGHRHYFEEEAINSWANSCIQGNRPITNPATRAEFRIADIQVDRELNRQIEQRLTLLLSQQSQET